MRTCFAYTKLGVYCSDNQYGMRKPDVCSVLNQHLVPPYVTSSVCKSFLEHTSQLQVSVRLNTVTVLSKNQTRLKSLATHSVLAHVKARSDHLEVYSQPGRGCRKIMSFKASVPQSVFTLECCTKCLSVLLSEEAPPPCRDYKAMCKKLSCPVTASMRQLHSLCYVPACQNKQHIPSWAHQLQLVSKQHS